MYKLVSLDLDGTLLNSNSELSVKNKNALDKCFDNELEIVIATGRPPRFTFDFIPKAYTDNYCVCYNGAVIYHENKIIFEKLIQAKLVEALIVSFSKEKLIIESRQGVYSNFSIEHPWESLAYKDINQVDDQTSVYKILIINPSDAVLTTIDNLYKDDLYMVTTDNGNYIELMHKEVSKLNAVQFISEREGFSLEEVVAFGDDLNDMEIINGVGYGVCMENGHDDLKQVADHVTVTNDLDGVSYVLTKIIEANNE